MASKLKKWILPVFAANVFLAVFVVPRIWEAQHVPPGLLVTSQASLNDAVVAACGPLTRSVQLVVDPMAASGWQTDPPGALPPAYLACTAGIIGPDPIGAVTLGPE